MKLDDISVERSKGAYRKSLDIMDLRTGEHFDFVDGFHLERVQEFASQGTDFPYDQAWKSARKHPGAREEDRMHVKVFGDEIFW